MRFSLTEEQFRLLKFWLPALLNASLVALLLLYAQTPTSRTIGLALVIMGMTLALRRMGSALSMVGGLALAFSPVFWSQVGGGQGEPATIVIAAGLAAVVVVVIALLSKRPSIGIGIGIIVFVVFFFSQIGTERSIRLTSFVISWLMFLLIDMLLLTNPRPEEAPLLLRDGQIQREDGSEEARNYHIWGILLLLAVGILNDPLLSLLLPSMALSLWLSKTKLHWMYWLIFGIVAGFGLRGIWTEYLINQSHFIFLASWRDGEQWLSMVELVVGQFSIVGVILGVLGIARLARWYPPLGIVTLLAYAAYWAFGLIYVANNRNLLLLPLYAVQILWMNYAVLALSEWFAKSFPNNPNLGRYFVIALYAAVPLFLFFEQVL